MRRPVVILAVLPALLVVVAGMALSYDALAVLARDAAVLPALAWFYPLVVDGVLVSASLAAYALRSARLRIRAYLWSLLGAGVAVSVVGNAAHALTHGGALALPPVAAALVSAVPPASLAAAVHMVIVLVRELGAGGAVGETAAETPGRVTPETGAASKRASAPRPAVGARGDRVAYHRRLTRLLRDEPAMTATVAARRLGIPRSTAARWLRDLRQPHVVDGEAAW